MAPDARRTAPTRTQCTAPPTHRCHWSALCVLHSGLWLLYFVDETRNAGLAHHGPPVVGSASSDNA